MGFSFLFLGALLALPLAGLPVLLHLLFRRKSPVVLFSTTRFIRASMQRTAARRRVQKWLLLAARILLLLLLILVAAQPAKKLAASLSGGGSSVAAIVIDTSYSMQLSRDGQTLLQSADATVVDLLQNELNGATVAIFKSLPEPANETLQPAGERLTKWTPLTPQPAPQPLANRIAAAQRLLDSQQAATKWLIVLTDVQTREFTQAMAPWGASSGANFAIFDLHPATARSAGVTRLVMEPDQPIPGIGTEAVARVSGRPGDSRAVTMEVASLDDKPLATTAPRVAQIDAAGENQMRQLMKLPAEPYLIVRARLNGDDDLAWDNVRQLVVQTPRQRKVKVISVGAASSAAEGFVKLALDPSEGRAADWPLRVESGKAIASDDAVVVCLVSSWADDQATAIKQVAERGGTVLLLLRPGLQAAWAKLTDAQRAAWQPLLPGKPIADPAGDRAHRAAPPAAAQTLLRELLDERFQLGAMTTQRLVPFERRGDSTLLLAAAPTGDGKPEGLLYRHRLGPGNIYTLATLPDPQFSTLATHPIFLPMLLRVCLPDATTSSAQNIELGEPLKLAASTETKLTLTTPRGETFVVDRPAGSAVFSYANTITPGLYRWTNAAGNVVGVGNVQYPADEAVLTYREAQTVMPGEQVLVVHSLKDFRDKLATLTQPSPRWSPLIAGVLMLLCFEAIVGNSSRLWKLWAK
jgi:hypothetical protein